MTPDHRDLVRFCAFPPERLADDNPEIAFNDGRSTVAWVARNGQMCHLPSVNSREYRAMYPGLTGPLSVREGTASELCLPIYVASRLVGTLNLESRFRDGYADSIEMAAAVAEQVGLALQLGRRAHEQTVMSMSTASTASVHELYKLVDELLRLAGGNGTSPAGKKLVAVARGITTCIQSGADLMESAPTRLSQLVARVLNDLELGDSFLIQGAPHVDIELAAGDALAVRVALSALFDNAYDNVHPDDPVCILRWRQHHLGGRDYVTLTIGNSVEYEHAPDRLRMLYRQPIRVEGSDRIHIGAFTAGALVRSVGGEVFVVRSEEERFVAGVDIPLPRDIMSRTRKDSA